MFGILFCLHHLRWEIRLPKLFRNFLSNPVEDRFEKQDIAFDYDVLNRLEEVDNQAYAPPETHGYTYDDVGNLETVSYANGVTHTYTYNTLNRLTNLAVTDSISQVLQSHTYTLNAVGHRTNAEEANGRVVDYEYDNLYRLTKEILGGTLPNLQDSIEYTYDDGGIKKCHSLNLDIIDWLGFS